MKAQSLQQANIYTFEVEAGRKELNEMLVYSSGKLLQDLLGHMLFASLLVEGFYAI